MVQAETATPHPKTESEQDREVFLALYSAAADQNRLYAEFRWKVLSFMSTLQGALLYATVQASESKHRVIYSLIGIAVTLFLLTLEERHKTLFYQARIAARDIENHLGVSDYGVFNAELRKKGRHNLIVRIWCVSLITGWTISLVVFLFRFISNSL